MDRCSRYVLCTVLALAAVARGEEDTLPPPAIVFPMVAAPTRSFGARSGEPTVSRPARTAAAASTMQIDKPLDHEMPVVAPAIIQASHEESSGDTVQAIDDEVSSTDDSVFEILNSPAILRGTPPRFGIRHDSGPGLGYRHSFSAFETLVPLIETPGRNLLFLDAELLLANTTALGANVGVVQRFYHLLTDRIFGAYAYYDRRDTGQRLFSQVAFGFETLGDQWDFRTNVYIPIGITRKTVSDFRDPFISGTSLLVQRDFQTAMAGFDMEMGTLLTTLHNVPIRGYAGWYHFQGDDAPQAWGVMTRFTATATRNIDLELALRNDRVFDTTVTFSVAYRLNAGRRPATRDSVRDRMAEQVVRNDNITVVNETELFPAINPASGTAIRVFQVDNMAVGGDGSADRPFGALADAETASHPGDIILVHGGDGTERGLDQGIALQDFQMLLGTGMPHTFTSIQGSFELPGAAGGSMPHLTATDTVVTLANNNVVAGLDIEAIGGPAIVGRGVTHAGIFDNTLRAIGQEGIRLDDVTGTVHINDNEIIGGGQLASGVFVKPSGIVTIQMLSNSIAQFGASGAEIVTAGNAILAGSFSQNEASSNGGAGIAIRAMETSSISLSMLNNVITDNAGTGIDVRTSDIAGVGLSAEANTVSRNGQFGLSIKSVDNSLAGMTTSLNSFDNNAAGGASVDVREEADVSVDFNSNIFAANGSAGIDVVASDESTIQVAVGGSVFEKNQVGLQFVTSDYVAGSLNFRNNDVSVGVRGVDVSTRDNSALNILVEGSRFANHQGAGLQFVSRDASYLATAVNGNRFLQNNTITGPAGAALLAQDASTFRLQLQSNDSDTGYELFNSGSSLFEVQDLLSTNVGSINQVGTLTVVPEGDVFAVDP